MITDQKNRIISLGFNGYPHGVKDVGLENREEKYNKIIHAEMNAILFSNRNITGCTLYISPLPPCSRCMTMIIQSGITRIVTIKPFGDRKDRWAESNKIAFDMAAEVGIQMDFIK